MTFLVALTLALAPQAGGTAQAWLAQAQQHFERQEWNETEAAARKALQIDPRLADAEVLLGLAAGARDQLAESEKHLSQAVALQPANYRALSYLASTYLRENRLDEAERGFLKVLQMRPGNTAAEYNLGLIALLRAKPQQALPRFRAVLKRSPSDVPALMGAVESALLLKDFETARAARINAESLLADSDPRLFQLATLLASHGQYQPAIRILERMRAAMPASYDIAYNLALAYDRSGQYERAADCIRPLLGKKAELWNLLGAVEEKRGRAAEALNAYRTAASLEPSNEDYRFDEAAAALQQESVEAAATAFSKAVREFPRSWRMRAGLGSALYLNGDYEGAARTLLEAVSLNPDAAAAYFLLGKTYEAAGALQPRILEALTSYATTHQDAWAEYHLGSILLAQSQSGLPGNLPAAKAHLEKALALNPTLAEAYVQMAAIAETEGRLDEGVRSLARAVEIDPALETPHYRLALAYRRMGQPEKAKSEMDLFRRLRAEAAGRDRNAVLHSLPR